jgi:alpha-beta hydrolase superfamily lysophospholipase
MPREFASELCRVVTSDGLTLEGLLCTPGSAAGDFPVSVFLLVHGTGSSFHAAGVLESFACQAVEAGVGVLRINTRGHGLVTRFAGTERAVWGGAAYETISDCRPDLAAWIGFLQEQGHERIGLVGHSMGAVKAIWVVQHFEIDLP